LNIKAKDPSQYASVAEFLNSQSAASGGIVDKVNYYQNKEAIDRLTGLIDSANRLGFILTIFLVCISVLITFNTIRLVIYMSKDEIAVMRLVGASTGYIRAPFFIEGALYGFFASIITIIIFYPVTIWLGKTTENFFVGLNVFTYYTENFGQIFLLLVVSGVTIGSVSSFLAVRKYLNV
jgi:cell division transport system permease protein